MNIIGPRFALELEAAGLLGLPFSWGDDGIQFGDALTPTQRAAVAAVFDAHDPALGITLDERAVRIIDVMDKLVFDRLFDIEKRLLRLENKPVIDRPTFRQILIDRWKAIQ